MSLLNGNPGHLTLEDFSDLDYHQFSQRVESSFRIKLGEYKSEQMKRRLMGFAKQAGCLSFAAYFNKCQSDAKVLQGFLDGMTINVTELMRGTDLFKDLGKTLLPELVAQRKGQPLNVWSAGCSYGAEAFTVAMLLAEMNPVPPYRIKGTDLDLTVLAKANQTMFSKADMQGVELEMRKKYFVQIDEDKFMVSPKLRPNVSFGQHDLLGTDYPADAYDLILCRNVVIYFTDEAKDRIYRNFFKSLRPNGILFVGGSERLSDPATIGFKPIKPFFYRADKEHTASLLKKAA